MEGSKRTHVVWAILALLVAAAGVAAALVWTQLPPEAHGTMREEVAEPDPQSRTEQLLEDLTLEQRVAQLFVVHPEDITGVQTVLAAGEATREAIGTYPVGGLIYGGDNLVDPTQTREIRNTQNYAKDVCGLPLFVCVDEEGGTVTRVADKEAFGVQDPGPARDLGEGGDVEAARGAASRTARYLEDLGFNVDFAPVADLAGPDSALFSRSFGDDPALVSSMVAAQVEAFGREGMLCCAKHFPGIGAALGDSHEQRIYSERTALEMDSFELVPFRAAIEAGVPMVMVGHLTCAGVDDAQLPASLDPAIVGGLLRETCGFEGLVVTDALEMGAVDVAVCPLGEQAVRAVEAGCDLVLCPADFQGAYEGLLGAVRSGRVSEERIDESCRRIIAAKERLGL